MKYKKIIIINLISLFLISGCLPGVGLLGAASSTNRTWRIIFTYNFNLSGDLKAQGGGVNGVMGADSLCQLLAPSYGVFMAKALIVDGMNRVACTSPNCSGGVVEHTNWVLYPNSEYRSPGGSIVYGTTTLNGIFIFPLTHLISANGVISQWWTGLSNDWTTNINNCSSWTNSTSSAGQYGVPSLDATAISFNSAACNHQVASLICVEQ